MKELKGKKIGVNNYGGNFDLYLRHMLEHNGLDPRSDAQLLEAPIPAVFPALDTKQIDAGVVPTLFVPVAEKRFPGRFKQPFTYRDIPDVRERPQLNQIGLIMNTSFLKNSRAADKSFVKATLEAQKWSYANRDEAVKAWAAEAGLPGLTPV